ncbi:ABC transporter permease [Variovorax saccharolyticus]|uniref:ABC transporter permease n=1 Tax=Variovorax saccharolyticus TaxID=3053516 RepID=UPI0025764FB6|nr:ABC transporter permease [Variovorax sp. J31P216]MDM0029962.1 ABC transporter permease [Variovorax sp. J31P216]
MSSLPPLETLAQPQTARQVPAPAPHRASRRPARWLGAVLPVAFLVGLELAVRGGWLPAHLLPPPSEVARTLADLAGQGLVVHVLVSTARVATGFVAGAGLAIALGVWVGLSRSAEAVLDPTFQALRAIPSLAWVPLLLLWLGIDEGAKLALIAIGAFFPVYMGVASGLRDVDRKLVEVAEMAGLGPIAMARRVLLPAALPAIWTGLRNGLSLAWMFMVAAELIAATRGLGYLLTDGRETGRADIVLAAIVLLALMGKLTDSGMQVLEDRWLSWRDTMATRA